MLIGSCPMQTHKQTVSAALFLTKAVTMALTELTGLVLVRIPTKKAVHHLNRLAQK